MTGTALRYYRNMRNWITVTKRGRPVATLQPMMKRPWKSPKGAWIGKVQIVGDTVNFDTSHLWDCLHKG
jgi:antitoxin (DNA-binding transcriptional repressor) of toxin-antitoxin stability system